MDMKRPNILFILCDDLGWTDLACYGSSFYETPNLDKLAARGMRFTDAYASCPVCSPTRASAMTGKYPASVGVTQFGGAHNVGRLCDVPYFDQIPLSDYTLAEALRERGDYQTWHVGKWHLGGPAHWPEKRGFDRNIGGCQDGMPHHGYFSPWKIPALEEGEAGEYLTDHLTDKSLKLIENRDPDRPFFLNYWPYAVHTPIQAPEALVEKYRKKADDLGLDQRDPIEEGPEMQVLHKLGKHIRRRTFQSDPVYAAMVENLDANIGRLLDKLEAEGERDNTLVVFTSDNGGLATSEGSPTCNAPLAEGKGWMYEGGTRECLIASWPGKIPEGVESGVVTTTPDFYPTFLEAAGLDPIPEQHRDGVSLMSALKGDTTFDRGAVFWHYPHYANQGGTPGCSVREGDWKLIRFYEDDRLEFYNLREDISEARDLSETEPETVRRLHEKLENWLVEVNALIPRANPLWERQKLARRH